MQNKIIPQTHLLEHFNYRLTLGSFLYVCTWKSAYLPNWDVVKVLLNHLMNWSPTRFSDCSVHWPLASPYWSVIIAGGGLGTDPQFLCKRFPALARLKNNCNYWRPRSWYSWLVRTQIYAIKMKNADDSRNYYQGLASGPPRVGLVGSMSWFRWPPELVSSPPPIFDLGHSRADLRAPKKYIAL